MSRFAGDEGDDWDSPARYLWDSWQRRAMYSKAALPRWQLLEDALLALPEPKLCAEYLYQRPVLDDAGPVGCGEVCAIGAVVAYHTAQKTGTSVAAVLAQWYAGWENGDDVNQGPMGMEPYDTVEAGTDAGLPHTFAWWLAELNDETLGHCTDEERYRCILERVREEKARLIAQHGGAA